MIRAINAFLAVALIVVVLFKVGLLGGAAVGHKGKAAKIQHYVVIASAPSAQSWSEIKAGLADKAKELGVIATFEGPALENANQQIAAIDRAISKKVDGIIVVPLSDAVSPAIDRAIAARIGVICAETDAPSSKRYTFIGSTPHDAGFAGGAFLAQELRGLGQVAVVSSPKEGQIADGYRDALSKSPGVRIAQVLNRPGPNAQPTNSPAEILHALPNLSGFACTGPSSTREAVAAVRQAGKSGEVKIVTIGTDPGLLDLVEHGVVTGTVGERSYTMTYLGLQMLYDLRNDRVKLVPDWRKVGVVPLPLHADTGSFLVTKRNVRYFHHK